jgi:D-glycero-D-manno-heptose 1,7-bisphosphate phosphatase
MQCVILVGGLGTRLGALTRDCPKPMLPVAGRPFLAHLIDNIARFGFTRFLLLAGYRADIVRAYFPSGMYRTPGKVVAVNVLAEPEPLGTGGAIRFAGSHLEENFLLLNGDTFFDFNLLDLVRPLDSKVGRMALRRVADAARYGVVTTAADGRVLEMRERPEGPGPGAINGGMYSLNCGILDAIPPEGPVSLEREVFPRLIAAGALEASTYDGFFLDIGVVADYQAAQSLFPFRRPAVFFDRDGVLNQDAGYTHRIADLRWGERAIEAVRAANDSGKFVFVVTNQSGVARGYYTEGDVRRLHAFMAAELARSGAHVDDWRYCPHHLDAQIPAYRAACGWRKPGPGMLLDLIATWPIDVGRSVMIGDAESTWPPPLRPESRACSTAADL